MKYNIVIAGCGFVGSVAAFLAAQQGKRVLLFEKRSHIAGNMYDYRADNNILVQKYGPHVMHTVDMRVKDFLCGLWKWDDYVLKSRSVIDGKYIQCPFNFQAIDDLYTEKEAVSLKKRIKDHYGEVDKISIVEMLDCRDAAIKSYADLLFEKDYRPYTAKQWGIDPEEIDKSVLKRVPVRFSYVDRCFDDPWQVLPNGGYLALFEKLLDSPNIELRLNEDILCHVKLNEDGEIFFDGDILDTPLLYTGPIDELFNCRFGQLPYRSLRLDFKTVSVQNYQEAACVVYPMEESFTRITEYSKLPYQDGNNKTIICAEYPVQYGMSGGGEAYYPILTEDSQTKAEQYKSLAGKYRNLYLCGRLADFRYYNMDQVVAKTLDLLDILPL